MSRTKHHGDKAKQRLFGKAWRWLRQCPKSWNKAYHIRPRRAEERHLLERAKQGEVEQVWPTGTRKPHEYFW